MLVFVNSPVPLDLFQKPSLHSSIVKSLSDKENIFFSGFPSTTNYLTGKYIVDKCVVTLRSVLEGKVNDFTSCGASSGLTRKAGIIHNCKRSITLAFVCDLTKYTDLHLSHHFSVLTLSSMPSPQYLHPPDPHPYFLTRPLPSYVSEQ